MKRLAVKVLFVAAIAYVVARVVDWQENKSAKARRAVSRLTSWPVHSTRWVPSLVKEDHCKSSTPMIQSGIYKF